MVNATAKWNNKKKNTQLLYKEFLLPWEFFDQSMKWPLISCYFYIPSKFFVNNVHVHKKTTLYATPHLNGSFFFFISFYKIIPWQLCWTLAKKAAASALTHNTKNLNKKEDWMTNQYRKKQQQSNDWLTDQPSRPTATKNYKLKN